MKTPIDRIRSVGNQRLEVVYSDGLMAVLDFQAFLADHKGPIVEPLRKERGVRRCLPRAWCGDLDDRV
jgi:hypothetical protein